MVLFNPIFARRTFLAGMLGAAAMVGALPACAQQVIEVQKRSPERKAILDVVRASVERRLGIKVIFVVERLAVYGNWAYAGLHPRTEAGTRIDYLQTGYAKDYIPDLDSDAVDVLLQRQGSSWSIVQEAFLPTDVIWKEWVKTYNLPHELFLPDE